MFKLKSFICGFLISSILSFGIYSFADGILKNISVAENSVTIKVNNKALAAPNFIYNGRTYVQVKDLTDALGQKLNWDANSKTVLVGENDIISSNSGVQIIYDKFDTEQNTTLHNIMFSDKFIVNIMGKETQDNMYGTVLTILPNSKDYDLNKIKIYGYSNSLNKIYTTTLYDGDHNFYDQMKLWNGYGKIMGYVYFKEDIDGIIFDDDVHKCKLDFKQK